VTALATFLIAAVAGPRSSGAAVLFEYLYLMAVIITTVVVARKMRRPPVGALLQAGPMGGAAAHRPRGYAATLLVLFGLAVLSCMAFGGIGILYMALDASLAGDPPPDALPLLLPTLIIAVAVAGGLQLLKLLRE
jgi:hypothetical protein